MDYELDFSESKVDLKIWKRLVAYGWRNKNLLFILIFGQLVTALVDIAYPLMQQYAIDHFVVGKTTEGILGFALLYALLVILQGSSVAMFIITAGKLEMRVSYAIRDEAYYHLQKLSLSYYDRTPVGYLMARMISDVMRLSELVAWSLTDILWGIFYVIGCVISMFSLNWKLALTVLVVMPPLGILCFFFQKKILKNQRIVRRTNSRITSAYNEGIMGAMTTKTLVREEKNTEEFKELSGTLKKAAIRSQVLSATFMPCVMILGSIGTSIALGKGSLEVLGSVITLGTLSAFISYTSQFFEPIQQIARIFAEMQTAQASAERVFNMMDTAIEVSDDPEVIEKYGDIFDAKTENWEDMEGHIEFRNVSFSYIPGEPILDDFSLDVKPGESIALVGETGAGKSTIVNLVCRFYEPTEGTILIDGRNYRERSQLWLEKNLGYMLQTPHLFSGTIRENIAYAKKDATIEEIRRAARMVHAEEFILKQKDGYDTQVGEGGLLLSTGQKQLICFARVVLANPKIFILDEATASIDTETEQYIQDAITTVLEGRTSFIVAHRLSTIRNSDRILLIDAGKIKEAGTHDELMEKKGAYYNLYTNQYREAAEESLLG
ncbi:MAG: ABC transporter ATP-binding protein [Christensenellaceae bacterium]|nr:ABC transporter ATP-binding protein [Christensenellaceae bacterium]